MKVFPIFNNNSTKQFHKYIRSDKDDKKNEP